MLLKYNLIVSTSSHKQVSTDGHDGWPSVHYVTFSYISSSSTYTAVTLGRSEELQTSLTLSFEACKLDEINDFFSG